MLENYNLQVLFIDGTAMDYRSCNQWIFNKFLQSLKMAFVDNPRHAVALFWVIPIEILKPILDEFNLQKREQSCESRYCY